jgi:hypothetical protein
MRIGLQIAIGSSLLIGCASKPSAPAPAPAQAKSSDPVIVKLVSRRQTVTVIAGPNGPLYSVTDASGKERLAPTPLNEIAAKDPELYREINAALASSADMSSRR